MVTWQHTQNFPQLNLNRVHIWRASLNHTNLELKILVEFLSADELERANRFRFAKDRFRFIAARAILRQLLGSYLAVDPHSLKFDYGERGKPLLVKSSVDIPLNFNVSHSQEYAIFGFAIGRLIGVDIEYQKAMPDALKIARRFFSQRESEMLSALSSEKQAQLFFQLWTAKESYLKAIGTGLAGSLSKIEIAIDRDRLLSFSKLAEGNASEWYLHSYSPVCNYLGAIVFNTHAPVKKIDFWNWSNQF